MSSPSLRPHPPWLCPSCVYLQTQKKPAVLYSFLLETMTYVNSNLPRIRIAACDLAGERADVSGCRRDLEGHTQAWSGRWPRRGQTQAEVPRHVSYHTQLHTCLISQLGIFSGILNRYLLRSNGISHWPNICVMSISLALVLGIIMQQMPAHHLKKLDFPALRNCK